MSRNFTTIIDDTQCIGDSLEIINSNYENLDTAVGQLSGKSQTPITVNNPTATIDLDLDSSLNLTGNVRENSITGALLAPGNIIQIVNNTVSDFTEIANGTSEQTITTFNTSILPANSQNKILLEARLCIAAPSNPVGIYVKKGTTDYTGPTLTSYNSCLAVIPQSPNPLNTYVFLDTGVAGASTQLTFNFIIKRPSSTALYINRSQSNASPNNFRTTSSITLYEIKA